MRLFLFAVIVVTICISACATKPLPPVAIKIPDHSISYLKEVKPLLEKRCTVCHSCYNSPCQLKLDSFEGVDRGATKKAIYNSSRLKTMDPTRLFIDAGNTEEWRKKEFFSVTTNTAAEGLNDSIMIQLLAHKMKNPKSKGEYRPESEDLKCSANGSEVADYLEKHPNNGMPFGFPPLKEDEFNTVAGWLYQGAKGPTAPEQKMLETPKPADQIEIAKWDKFFNNPDPKYAMTARYIYEHLFLAHIRFGSNTNDFYELVRSKTPSGAAIDIIPTVRPFDDPETDKFYYRFRKIHSTIVQKTHMVYQLDDARMKRYNELFIEPQWLQKPFFVTFDSRIASNPFVVFEQIPPKSRYQFLLDSSQYMVMTFIHGPVCKGQIALNVIEEQFWVMFMDPDHDISVRFPGFLRLNANKLSMPIEKGSDMGLISAIKNEHKDKAIDFYKNRQEYNSAINYAGLGYDAIWKGNSPADAPLLTIYRHFDNASVHKGALGNLPKTVWIIDYPLFERIYYALVAGFDVYGTAGHQLALRLYMDRLRIEGESYFLDFMPQEKRTEMMASWYLNTKLEKISYSPSPFPAAISFATADPKREFIENVIGKHLNKECGIIIDKLNYMKAGESYPLIPDKFASDDDYMRGFRAITKPGTHFVSVVNNNNANLAYMRVRLKDGKDVVATFIVNRWHDNVAFLFGEEDRLHPEKDYLELVPGMIGSYPNMFFDVTQDDIPDFLKLINEFDGSDEQYARLAKYAINRSDDRFWDEYDWFQKRFMEDEPIHGGLLDLNRYYLKAM
ncbi:MAG: fatty acid cis/trans isomerase [Geobacteraceae bacterium]|nr:fatty acid cis/trans isomerase [Geobacteraceae bacterium]